MHFPPSVPPSVLPTSRIQIPWSTRGVQKVLARLWRRIDTRVIQCMRLLRVNIRISICYPSRRVCKASKDTWNLYWLVVFSCIEWPLYLCSFMVRPQTFWTPLVYTKGWHRYIPFGQGPSQSWHTRGLLSLPVNPTGQSSLQTPSNSFMCVGHSDSTIHRHSRYCTIRKIEMIENCHRCY